MRLWTKINSDILYDVRIINLMGDYGWKGFGIYMAVRLYVCSVDLEAHTLGELQTYFRRSVSQTVLERILRDYGLFSIDQDFHVHVQLYAATGGDLRPQVHNASAEEPKPKKETFNKRNVDANNNENGNDDFDPRWH